MQIAFEKRHRIAGIFAKVAEYTAAILILGPVVSKQVNMIMIIMGLFLFVIFLAISAITEPVKEGS
ncbi:MAG: hypothetical protein QME05_04830 [Candidatus Margulisbacteria bacterium]|nr:hypothetical protein [Candidatus Margulisiibacteriota bacterium]